MTTRKYTMLDTLVMNLDQALRTVAGQSAGGLRENPSSNVEEPTLSDSERKEACSLMRVNHSGEVAAQALYQGHAVTARSKKVVAQMREAAEEENDHLDWCAQRVEELGGHLSYLNPAWYAGSFAIGAIVGAVGDKWSLGFVAETERQVAEHLDKHLEQISGQDSKSRAIISQMKEDEIRHGEMAQAAGGVDLPAPIQEAMKLTSKIMTSLSYRI